jgi:multidrug transporter EmrE-like cation transporter
MLEHKWALWSGCLGATAACVGKIAFTSNSLSPLHNFNQNVCQANMQSDLDAVVLKYIYWILGDLMIKYQINLMPYWRVARVKMEEAVLFLHVFEVDWCEFLMLGPRILCFVTMLIINAYMIASFLKGMKHSGSVVGTALSSGANFVLSALYGNVIWNEQFSQRWWIGFATVMAGVMLLTTVTTDNKNDDNPKSARARPISTSAFRRSETRKEYVPKKLPLEQYVNAAAPKKAPPGNIPRPSLSSAKIIGPSRAFLKKKNRMTTSITDRFFTNECPLCQEELFVERTGESATAIADLSPNCFHVMHAKCLVQQSSNKKKNKKSNCVVCEKPISMWIRTKQAASLAGFWVPFIEKLLRQVGPPKDEKGAPLPLSMSVVRKKLHEDSTLTEAQKQYIDDDPSGLEKGLASCIAWGGTIDYNQDCIQGNVGWYQCLVTQGLWDYDARKDEIWFHEWGMHPKQRCEQCQLSKRPLAIECRDCKGSSEAAVYCSETCQKRDFPRHKTRCQIWQKKGPP